MLYRGEESCVERCLMFPIMTLHIMQYINTSLTLYTYHSILFHPGFHLLQLPRHHPWKNRRVCAFTEEQIFSWSTNTKTVSTHCRNILVCLMLLLTKLHFTCARLHYDAHSPPDRVEVQHVEQLKPEGDIVDNST